MTKTAAIKTARKEVNADTTWYEAMNMWNQNHKHYNASELKEARISYALKLLGVDNYTADYYARQSYGLSFVEAVYKYN